VSTPGAVRPATLLFVLGTATDVGKTWVAAALLRTLREDGVAVAGRKPVVSFDPGADPATGDVAILAAASGEDPGAVCPPHRSYAAAMAPPIAAAVLGLAPFGIADLAGELVWSPGVSVGVVEGAGGVRSPLAADGDAVDLAALVRPDLVVLVAPSGLGALHEVRTCAPLLRAPVAVVLNRYDASDEVHRRNRAWLLDEGRDVFTLPGELVGLVGRVRGA
jgi:dethiobiotin synthetase